MGGTSRRHRSNQKSVIFTKQAFDESFKQSPSYEHFKLSETQQGLTDTLPIDLHVDLGNYCNLACKMCYPIASTTIAVQHVQWGIESDRQYLGLDWTKDNDAWLRFLNELLTIPKLKNGNPIFCDNRNGQVSSSYNPTPSVKEHPMQIIFGFFNKSL